MTNTDNNSKKQLCIGLLAHADAGKTTLSEGLLYLAGSIRKVGRVDHGDAFLDTYALEKERGITIFSKQARLKLENTEITLLDTPGHADFSSEMERTLRVLDYAILVVSGMDGIQSHTVVLWNLLDKYHIPVFLFVNKMDQEGCDHDRLLMEIQKRFNTNCIDFCEALEDTLHENLATCSEEALERYLENGRIADADICSLIKERKVFPCFFGSALKMTGVREFLAALEKYTMSETYPEDFGAKVYKIARDEQGTRLTYLKVTGGGLRVKTVLDNHGKLRTALPGNTAEDWAEKIDQIRLYSGAKYDTAAEVPAGTVCAVTGLTRTYPGEGLGKEEDSEAPVLEPVLSYRIILPDGQDVNQMLKNLKELEEEDPQLHIFWDPKLMEIHARLMGEVQTEVLKRLIWDRYHVAVEFGEGSIVYKETVADVTEGVGHFEPLRHYAEVHVLIEPGEPGSGCQFFTACSEDVLARNWQRLILTHLEEKEHLGVLTGSSLTDVRITLISGRAHAKHTEGGDFRQATYRAVRQGLRKAHSVLLEPYYEFRFELPAESIGRAMADISRMKGSFLPPLTDGEISILTGTAPVQKLRGYPKEIAAYTGGRGRVSLRLRGYAPCQEQDEIVKETGYDPEHDLENPTGSVFCAHGAGFIVPWDEVENYMHMEGLPGTKEQYESAESVRAVPEAVNRTSSYSSGYEEDRELQKIFERTFGPVKRDPGAWAQKNYGSTPTTSVSRKKAIQPKDEYLLVDGYNIIFSWEELKDLAKENLHAACTKLMDILSDYQGYRRCTLILVFDAYKLEGHAEETIRYQNIHVVYTKEAETADQYIEKTVHKIGRQNQVSVATSDGLEQIIVLGQGAHRISAKDLKLEIEAAKKTARENWQMHRISSRRYLLDEVTEEVSAQIRSIKDKKK